jgi:hypothetical protein
MRNPAWLAIALCALVASSLPGQTIVDNGVDDRIEALNAVFAFRSDLARDKTVIARCSLPTGADSSALPGLEPRFQALLASADTSLTGGDPACAVHGFADDKLHVLFLENLVENSRSSSVGRLPPYRSKKFEITFQHLQGPGYREYHHYIVEPSGITAPSKDMTTMQFAGWRVTEYRLAGWDFHWGDTLGHGSGVRLP